MPEGEDTALSSIDQHDVTPPADEQYEKGDGFLASDDDVLDASKSPTPEAEESLEWKRVDGLLKVRALGSTNRWRSATAEDVEKLSAQGEML